LTLAIYIQGDVFYVLYHGSILGKLHFEIKYADINVVSLSEPIPRNLMWEFQDMIYVYRINFWNEEEQFHPLGQ